MTVPGTFILACILLLTGCNDAPQSQSGPSEAEAAAGRDIVLTIDGDQQVDAARVDETVVILRRRLDALGVAEAEVGADSTRVVVTLPSSEELDPAFVVEVLARQAALEFRKVVDVVSSDSPQFKRHVRSCNGPVAASVGQSDQEVVRCDPTQPTVYRLGPALLTNTDVEGAQAQQGPGGGSSIVELDLTREGAEAFERVTGELACEDEASPTRLFGIVLDGFVISAPAVAPDVACGTGIGGGKAVITTGGGAADAEALAVALRAGALPLTLSAETINP